MTVQAADFIAVQPYNQTILSIGIGVPLLLEVRLIQGNHTTSFSKQINKSAITG
jgi:hypothetical protein